MTAISSHPDQGCLTTLLGTAINARRALHAPEPHNGALRLFNGFLEGCPELVIDLYAATAVIHNYARTPDQFDPAPVTALLRKELPWLRCIMVKTRYADTPAARNGVLVYGTKADRRIEENGVWYAIDLSLNRDCSFYLDTRNLRAWIMTNLGGKSVLNTFAYTGSLGVAAQAAGAARVVQMDRSKIFLNLAKQSLTINRLPICKADFLAGDFWKLTSRLRHQNASFDCVILDPPFQAKAVTGEIDLAGNNRSLINKVRPLVNDNGWLVTINNALFLPGQDYQRELHELCADGYLAIEELIPVPTDVTGYPETIAAPPPVSPAPFNHTTKIAILRVRRKK